MAFWSDNTIEPLRKRSFVITIENDAASIVDDFSFLAKSTDKPTLETDVNEYKLIELSELFLSLDEDATQLEIEIHKRAKLLLEKNNLEEAWLTLLSFNN